MSRGAMNKDVKYYCTRCQELEQELAELKAQHKKLGFNYTKLKALVIKCNEANYGVFNNYVFWRDIMQAVGLANTDSKEESDGQ